jgi:hypothetical protein
MNVIFVEFDKKSSQDTDFKGIFTPTSQALAGRWGALALGFDRATRVV